jgi:hypothetical protein
MPFYPPSSSASSEGVALRGFRTLDNEDVITYDDGSIAYTGADKWVQLPEVDTGKVGTTLEFYGYNSTGYTNGFYTNDGDTILLPEGGTRNWFSVPSNARVRAQLGDDSLWHITVIEAGIVNLPFATGEYGLNLTDGSRWYIGYLTGDTYFAFNGGRDGDTAEVMIGWTQSAPTLEFSSSIKMPSDLSALMPITLEAWRSYSFECLFRGGYWTLKDIQGPTVEAED